MTHTKKLSFPLLLLCVAVLSACAGGATSTASKPVVNTMEPELKTSAIDRAMETALKNAEASGDKQEVLAILEKVQARNPKDPIVATRYARALRDDEQINAAIRTLTPFTRGDNANIEAITEMSMTQLTLGDFDAAEDYAQQAIEMNPKNARAYLAMGTAQDAQGRHQEAEVSFRQGVKYWQGDASPILNNLALNLASQGHLEEALTLIEKAQKMAPNRLELERNRRIISTLLEANGPRPPAPDAKPTAGQSASTPAAKPEPKAQPKPAPQKTEKPAVKKEEEVQKKATPSGDVSGMKSNIKLKPLNQQ